MMISIVVNAPNWESQKPAKYWKPAKEQNPYGDFMLIDSRPNGVGGEKKITWEEAAMHYGIKFVAGLFRRAVKGSSK